MSPGLSTEDKILYATVNCIDQPRTVAILKCLFPWRYTVTAYSPAVADPGFAKGGGTIASAWSANKLNKLNGGSGGG